MFKKPLKDTKPCVPLRSSDRRKLRQRIVKEFCPDLPDDGDLLVPDGLQSMKVITHSGELGVIYVSPEGDPLWFSTGKDVKELVPTVYTLWKRSMLIPSLSAPSHVISILSNGADLMTAGIMEMISLPKAGTIVCVTPYMKGARGPALAVGRLNFDAEDIINENVSEGKAVTIMHTWKDHLWARGSKVPPPEGIPLFNNAKTQLASTDETQGAIQSEQSAEPSWSIGSSRAQVPLVLSDTPGAAEQDNTPQMELTAEEISSILREALLQAIRTSVSALPVSAFPVPASTFYTTHVLPARPISVASASPAVDIKHSAFKSFGAFLKQAEKQGLLRLKDSRGDISITSVNVDHDDVSRHSVHRTIGEFEGKMKKQKERAEQREQEEEAKGKQIAVTELWKPHQTTVKLFQEAQIDISALCTLQDLKAMLDTYITSHDLVNKADQQFINSDVDPTLREALWPQTGKSPQPVPEFAKREELLSALCSRMQPWYRMQVGSGEVVTKSAPKGQLQPISVVVKIRQGRKACTLVTGYEPYLLASDIIADTLRSKCASATSINPVPGRTAGEEVMVQGKQVKAVVDFLEEAGVSKKWIHAEDTTGKKK
ncbi:hypothetical protein K488DRAFT_43160 [Vararia minispora EC-137]|uniref:Uncharacterized protein n=1 Tax=Vararia minispora EC-137 TaxID=1314806 RepID=A0ACB8QUM3_9AGAM|nr:hypothetical protein K488DRAFT_43160 [Vararia minispora EC-137]